MSKEENLAALHEAAETDWATFSYAKPDGVSSGKGFISLGRKDIVRGVVQVVKKDGGENNLHYHSGIASFWFVLKGRVRFYGPGDVVLGEFGSHEGMITPRFSRYWFENCGEGDLEILQVAAFGSEKLEKSGRTDVSAKKFDPESAQRFEAKAAPAKV